MEDTIIDITAEVKPVELTAEEQLLKQVEQLNNETELDKGEWRVSNQYGIVWCPNVADRMGTPLGVPSPSTPPPVIGELVKWGNTMDFDNIAENSVVIIKLNINDPFRVQMMQRVIAKQVLEPRIEKLKEKRVCILFMQAEDDISVMTEAEMESAGWTKTNKSLIISPFSQ